MSIQALAWVLEHSEATLGDRLVLIAIANHANASGLNAWPSASQIAREAKVDRRTVQRAILDLEKLGEIMVVRRPGRPSVFRLPLGQIVTGEGGTGCPTGGTSTPKTWDNLSHEPSLTVMNRRGRARRAPTDTSPLTGPAPVDRCSTCQVLSFDCRCGEQVDKEKGKESIRSIRSVMRGEQPA